MTKNHRVIDRPAVVGRPLMQIAAANTHIFYLKQHIFFSKEGRFDFS